MTYSQLSPKNEKMLKIMIRGLLLNLNLRETDVTIISRKQAKQNQLLTSKSINTKPIN